MEVWSADLFLVADVRHPGNAKKERKQKKDFLPLFGAAGNVALDQGNAQPDTIPTDEKASKARLSEITIASLCKRNDHLIFCKETSPLKEEFAFSYDFV